MAPEEQNATRGVVDDERGSIGGRPDDVVLEPLTVRELDVDEREAHPRALVEGALSMHLPLHQARVPTADFRAWRPRAAGRVAAARPAARPRDCQPQHGDRRQHDEQPQQRDRLPGEHVERPRERAVEPGRDGSDPAALLGAKLQVDRCLGRLGTGGVALAARGDELGDELIASNLQSGSLGRREVVARQPGTHRGEAGAQPGELGVEGVEASLEVVGLDTLCDDRAEAPRAARSRPGRARRGRARRCAQPRRLPRRRPSGRRIRRAYG